MRRRLRVFAGLGASAHAALSLGGTQKGLLNPQNVLSRVPGVFWFQICWTQSSSELGFPEVMGSKAHKYSLTVFQAIGFRSRMPQ